MEDSLKRWLARRYPCTICVDRYGGAYSGARWTAFMEEAVPDGAQADDVSCAAFWDSYVAPVGRGATPDEAYNALVNAVRSRE